MALTNFTEDENQKTFIELFCSAEFIRGVDSELIFLSAINIFLSITAFLRNTLILVALRKETSLHPPSKLLYRNLALTDLCVGIIVEPLYVTNWISVVKERWDTCYYSLQTAAFSGYTLCVVSALTLTAISVDRLLALLLGLRYRQVVTLRRTGMTVIGFWILSIVGAFVSSHHNLRLHKNFLYSASSPNSFSEPCCSRTTEPSNSTEYSSIQKGSLQCTVGAGNNGCLDTYICISCLAFYSYPSLLKLVFKSLAVLLEDQRTGITVIGFWILSIVGASTIIWNLFIFTWYQYAIAALCPVTTIFAYTKIFCTLRHHQIHFQNHVAQGQPSQAIPLNIARYRKAVYSALWVQGTMVVCYLPFTIAVTLMPQRGIGIPISAYRAWHFTATLVYLNSSLNPLLYCWKISEVREATKMALTNCTEDENRLKTFRELLCSAEYIRDVDGEFIILSTLTIFLSITAFLGNTLILVALHKETSLHPLSKLLYRNLAITDLSVGIIVDPLAVTYLTSVVKERWDICYHANWAANFLSYTLCTVSLLTLTAISVDRLLALLLGLSYKQVVTLRRTYIIVIVFWIFSAVGASAWFWNPLINSMSRYLLGALCLVITIVAYTKIFFSLRHNQIHNHVAQGQPSQAIPLNTDRYLKAVYSALWVQGTLVICYLPYVIAVALTPQREMPLSIYLARSFTLNIIYLNSSLNPLLYCWQIREVRQAVKERLKHFFR
ncbi:unnamed protein product [Porites evermanni]|uniref:G-protein coupled receptors family 1 profile domain-containing protein n=1 Tax=Porites evermanni TaxID=104178 RepID=A0ABN8SY82_9CNID|nr:unnamed protein product [Porites evermanni]